MMDPTKSFDHLDPKLKDTYARVMGTNITSNDSAAIPPVTASQNQFGTVPPADGVTPTLDPSPLTSATLPNQPQESSAPTTSSFFSNPTQKPGDSSQFPPEDVLSIPPEPQLPITPYTPNEYQDSAEQFTTPLPSPSSVNQAASQETSPLLKVLYIVGAVIFFAVYTIFWIKIFGLPFPI